MSDIQLVGFDGGRGYVDVCTEVNGERKEVMFKSIYGDGRDNKINYSIYDNPIHIEFNGENYFVGLLAENESYSSIRNSQDSKTSETMQILLAAALEQVVVKPKVKIMFGVTYKNYKKSVLEDIRRTYKGKTFVIKNKITGATKTITIVDVDIFREGDAAAFEIMGGRINEDRPLGVVNIGFRTTELSYFAKGFEYNDMLSNTIEYGNSSMLKRIEDELLTEGIAKNVNEIDSADEYNDKKLSAYKFGSEKINQLIEEKWINKKEMDLYLCGGTSLHLTPKDNFKRVEDPQLVTARGLLRVLKLDE